MGGRNSPPASTSSGPVLQSLRRRAETVEEEGGDTAACTGRSCESCTAGVIADCVALCCCPCGLVSILALTFLKLPWAVARRCLSGPRRGSRRRGMLEDARGGGGGGSGTPDIGLPSIGGGDGEGGAVIEEFGAEIRAEDVWLELYEVGHLGFGRVSFTGVPFHDRPN